MHFCISKKKALVQSDVLQPKIFWFLANLANVLCPLIIFLWSFNKWAWQWQRCVCDVVRSMWCCKFWSTRCASSQRHWVTQRSSPWTYQAAMTETRQGRSCLGGDRGGLQMTNMRMSASSLTAYLGLYLSAPNFLPVHLPICLSTACSVTLCIYLSVSLCVCLEPAA